MKYLVFLVLVYSALLAVEGIRDSPLMRDETAVQTKFFPWPRPWPLFPRPNLPWIPSLPPLPPVPPFPYLPPVPRWPGTPKPPKQSPHQPTPTTPKPSPPNHSPSPPSVTPSPPAPVAMPPSGAPAPPSPPHDFSKDCWTSGSSSTTCNPKRCCTVSVTRGEDCSTPTPKPYEIVERHCYPVPLQQHP